MESWIVVCRADRKPDSTPGDYELATRQAFSTRSAAEAYAQGISDSREPLIVAGRFADLWFQDRPPWQR